MEAIDAYEVEFAQGLEKDTVALLTSSSQLIARKDSLPATSAGLRNRADADISNFIKVLHSLAYYNATVHIDIDFEKSPIVVLVKIDTGPVYLLESLRILPDPSGLALPLYGEISLEDLHIVLQTPATPKKIITAEVTLLNLLAKNGYPLAKITKRDVVADQKIKALFVTFYVDSGPLTYFGETLISGQKKIKDEFFKRKIFWKKGSVYDPKQVERTQGALEASGLFSSITISNAEEVTPNNALPMTIQVIESKHRSIGGGLTYATERGPGIAAEWEHRNVGRMGEKISLKANLWGDTQEGTLLYVKPDYLRPRQDLLWLAEFQHEKIKAFTEYSYSISSSVERQVNDRIRLSYGIMYKKLYDTRSFNNGIYDLIKTPFYFKWSNANNLLDPTKGGSINLKVIPSVQFLKPQFFYCINIFTGTIYHALTSDNRYVFASKLLLGSIAGSNKHTIPSSEKFYEGGENALRGYRYQTVSPLDHEDDPIGGRSMMVYTFELRAHATETFGWALFYDVGNVYADPFPKLNFTMLQSVGVGLRYYTPVGPLRLDVAFPLNPRPHLDNRFQLYFSIGQAF